MTDRPSAEKRIRPGLGGQSVDLRNREGTGSMVIYVRDPDDVERTVRALRHFVSEAERAAEERGYRRGEAAGVRELREHLGLSLADFCREIKRSPPTILDGRRVMDALANALGLEARMLGRESGLKGGKARAETLDSERRTEIARNAARARWNRRKREET